MQQIARRGETFVGGLRCVSGRLGGVGKMKQGALLMALSLRTYGTARRARVLHLTGS